MTRLDAGPRHRDVLGSDVIVRRGVLNLMTSGAGIAHSEYSVGDDAVPLDALQLWVALPESRRDGAQAFEASLPLADQSLLYLGIHRDRVEVTAERDATLFALGGEPFEADIVMWWNFVARTHEEIVTARDAWGAEGAPGAAPTRFGHVVGHGDERIPAPPLPAVRLTQRRRRP